MFKFLTKNGPNTTLVAIGGFLTAVGLAITAFFDGDPETGVNFQNLWMAAIAAGGALGFWAAGDKPEPPTP